jgi:hypothetical protein
MSSSAAFKATLHEQGPFVIVAKIDVIPRFPRDFRIRKPAMDPIEFAIQFSRYVEATENLRLRKNPRAMCSPGCVGDNK